MSRIRSFQAGSSSVPYLPFIPTRQTPVFSLLTPPISNAALLQNYPQSLSPSFQRYDLAPRPGASFQDHQYERNEALPHDITIALAIKVLLFLLRSPTRSLFERLFNCAHVENRALVQINFPPSFGSHRLRITANIFTMEQSLPILARANEIYARANTTTSSSSTSDNKPPVYKAVGISLAVASGVFIGTSFVLKKTGLLKANVKYNEEAGEGYGYLKNAFWWTGMTLMIIGEICNFVAYAFVDAILVTPLGALSVVITTILSAIFLKERLSFVGKVGCFSCIIGSVVIVMNAPEQSSAGTIQEMQHFVLSPGFLSYAGVIVVTCTFIALWVGPRYGKKSMLVYLSICSLIGGLSVVATQGLGAAVVSQARGIPQFTHWFLYVLLVFVVVTLVTEIIFLNVGISASKYERC